MKDKKKIKERKKIENNIKKEISNCDKKDKIYILNMIASVVDYNNIYENNEGVCINMNLLDYNLLVMINNFINNSVEKTKINFKNE